MAGETFANLPEFTATFELLEYTGSMNYTPRATNLTGSISWTQTAAANTLTGAIAFTKVATNSNQLNLLAGSWTNAAGQGFSYKSSSVNQDTTRRTNYLAQIEFDDGDPPRPPWITVTGNSS